MNNQEKIDLVSSIVNPYFNFNMNDMYGDRGGPIPKIEEIKYLFFKEDGTNERLKIDRKKEEELVNEVINLNIGNVQIFKVNAFGKFICIELKNDCEMNI